MMQSMNNEKDTDNHKEIVKRDIATVLSVRSNGTSTQNFSEVDTAPCGRSSRSSTGSQ